MDNYELSPAYYLANNNVNVYKYPSNIDNNYSNNDYRSYEFNSNYFPEPVINEYKPNDSADYNNKNGFYTNNELTESVPQTENYADNYNYINENDEVFSSKDIDKLYSQTQNNSHINSTDIINNDNVIYTNENGVNIPLGYNNNIPDYNNININEQKYPYNTERNKNTVTQNKNMKILNKYESTQTKQQTDITNLNQILPQVYPTQGINMKNNDIPINNTKNKNNPISNDSNMKTIPIPNNVKKNNFFSEPNKNNYQKIINKPQTQLPPKIIRHYMPNASDINNKAHNVPKNNITNINKMKEIEEKNKLITDYNSNETKVVQDVNDNLSKDIVEITDGITYLEIPPENTFKFRPLTQDDYKNIFLKGVGIINLGNTCFINSCLQALIHCKLFIHRFFDKISKMKEDTTPISYNFLLLCIEMLDIEKRDKIHYIDISYFKYIFGKKHPIFNNFSQNDSQEFCRIFLEDLSTELNEAKNKDIYRTLTNSDNKTKNFKDNEFFNNFKERENSIINDLFYSQIITSFKCKCGAEIYSFQKLLDFPLLIPENVKRINIKDLLNIYFKSELVDFEKKCDKCQQIAKHKKEMKISRPPEILILSLQRINETTKNKNNCPVIFREDLNIYDYIDHDLGFDKECDYTLFSIINHMGILIGGHYFTYIKPLGGSKWFEFNDSSVRAITPKTSVFSYAYALIYVKNKYK